MDILERRNWIGKRHPWETARADFVVSLLQEHLGYANRQKVLDIGCGDGYVLGNIMNSIGFTIGIGFDPELDTDLMHQVMESNPGYILVNQKSFLDGMRFDLVLLLDVLEHVDDDLDLLSNIVSDLAAPSGHLLITVPAFSSLFSPHDVFLNHRRRYNLENLINIIDNCDLSVIRKGYFFFSPLLGRFTDVLWRKTRLFPEKFPNGVANWNHGTTLSQLLGGYLKLENKLMYRFSKMGMTIPGLSAYVLCQKQP